MSGTMPSIAIRIAIRIVAKRARHEVATGVLSKLPELKRMTAERLTGLATEIDDIRHERRHFSHLRDSDITLLRDLAQALTEMREYCETFEPVAQPKKTKPSGD